MISTVQDAEITLLKSGELTLVYAQTHTHTYVWFTIFVRSLLQYRRNGFYTVL